MIISALQIMSLLSGYISTHINLPQYKSLNVCVREMRDNGIDYTERIQLPKFLPKVHITFKNR